MPVGRFALGVLGVALFCTFTSFQRLRAEQNDSHLQREFRSVLLPTLIARCLACHGGEKTEGGYSIQTLQLLMKAGDSGKPPMVKKNPAESELLRRLTTHDRDERMPLDAPALQEKEINILRDWIVAGGDFSARETMQPIAELVTVVRGSSIDRKPIDVSRPSPIASLAFNPKSNEVAIGGRAEVQFWNLSTGQPARRLSTTGTRVTSISWSPSLALLAVASGEPGERGTVELFELDGDAPRVTLVHQAADVSPCVAFSPEGKQLAIAMANGGLAIIDAHTKASTQIIPHADAVTGLNWSKDGRQLLTSSRDRTSKLFAMPSAQLMMNYDRHERAVGMVAFMDQNPVSLDETGRLRMWKLEEARTLTELSGLPRLPVPMTSLNGEVLVAERGELRRFTVERKEVPDGKDDKDQPKTKKVTQWMEHDRWTSRSAGWILSLAAEGDYVLAGKENGELIVWEKATGNIVHRLTIQ